MEGGSASLDALRARLVGLGRVVVAFSGGVDSAFLAAVAHEALGGDAVAVTGVSESLDPDERRDAARVAAAIGIRHVELETHEMESRGYVENSPDRCYHCKSELFSRLLRFAKEEGFRAVLDGTNASDEVDRRPGARAAAELGVLSPLREAGVTKPEIRRLSREVYGLPTWDKPELACLSSRIPYGTEVTPERLRAVSRAEAGLRELGFQNLRVRHHGEVARVEIGEDELERALDSGLRAEMSRAVKAAGFLYVALDLDGYRRGSLNDGMKVVALVEEAAGRRG